MDKETKELFEYSVAECIEHQFTTLEDFLLVLRQYNCAVIELSTNEVVLPNAP